MKLISFSRDGVPGFGRLSEDGQTVVDCSANYASLREALSMGMLHGLASIHGREYPLAEIDLQPPITNAQKYFCIGVNYGGRNAEYKDGSEPPKFPSVFMRSRESFVGHSAPILRPSESDKLDYEGEIVIVIGKEGRRIAESDWRDHIAGFSLMNEGTLRDWVRHAKFNVTQGKNFEASGSFGPSLVTPDAFLDGRDVNDLRLQTRVNGELRQDDTTATMAFPIPYIVSYLSRFARLQPGDVIATGTPNGAGARFDPPRYLVPGDVVEISCDGLDTLRNTVEDEVV